MDQIKNLNQRSWKERAVNGWERCAVAVEAILFSSAVNHYEVFAESESDGIASAVTDGLKLAWGVLRAIGIPVSIIAIAFCAFQFFLNGDKGMEVAKKRILYIIVGIAVLFLAPLLITKIAGWFNSNSDWNDVNEFSFTNQVTE